MMFVTPVFSVNASADGHSVRFDTALDSWEALAERDQFCIINYHDGIEKMIVQIQLDGPELRSSDKVAWLFPIPSAPESVSLKHFQIIPRFDGGSLGSAALERIADSTSWGVAFGTQLYTTPVIATSYLILTGSYGMGGVAVDVEVLSILDQYGVTSEVLATNDSNALSDYLTSKELVLPEESQNAAENYLDGSYCMVLSWISNVSEFLTHALKIPGIDAYSLGIGVEFPCDDIFFPLEMTSAYGALEIPITVQILDHVNPDVYPSGGDLEFSCRYMVQDVYAPLGYDTWNYDYELISRINITESLEEYDYFFSEQIAENDGKRYLKSVGYTVVMFDGPAALLSEDLWLSDSRPLSVSVIGFLHDHPWVVVLAVFMLVSCISSLIACVIVFGWNAQLTRTFILLGVANFFSIVGYYIAYDAVTPRLERADVITERKGLRLMMLFSGLFIYQLGLIYLLLFYSPTAGM